MELVAEKYKQTDIGLIPSDWDVQQLRQLSTLITKGTTPKRFSETGINYIKIESLEGDNIDIDKCLFVDDVTHKTELKRSILNAGDLLFAIAGATIGKCTAVPKQIIPANTNQALAIIRLKAEENRLLVFYFLKSSVMQKFILDNIAGGAQPNLNLQQVGDFSFPLPPTKAEQTAIATALSDADALVTSLEKLIAKKQNIKQGAMQQLLTPKENWEVKKLGEVVNIKKGQLITDNTRVEGNVPVIAGGKSPAYYHNKPNRIGKTITISGSGASAGYVAFHTYPIFASDCSTIGESNDYSIEFIFFLLQMLQERIYKMQTGGAQPHIHPSDLNPVEVSIPKKEEQIQIANILNDMATEIAALEKRLTKAQSIKQSMMQQLLTGKIRLV